MSGSKASRSGAPRKRPTQRRPLQLALRTRKARLALLGFVLLAVAALVAGILIPGSIGTARPNVKPDVLSCPAAKTVTVGTLKVPAGPVAGYCQPQLLNAATIMNVGRELGLNHYYQSVGVMTAIGESGLRNLNYGDKVGPDSRGLFQQRANYGPLADRLNPTIAAHAFFTRLIGIKGFEQLTPTQAAHAVQGNADPNYYTQYFRRAQAVVGGLVASTKNP